ncbi:hypothetical protein D3C75_690260 [compost metagenome]
MQQVHILQPNMTVNAAALIPPSFAFRCVHFDENYISALLPKTENIRQIITESYISSMVLTEQMPIDPYCTCSGYSVETNHPLATRSLCWKPKDFAVKTRSSRQIAMTSIPCAERLILNILLLHTPVVRQSYRSPFQLLLTHSFIIKSDIQPRSLKESARVGNTACHSTLDCVGNSDISFVKAPILIKHAFASRCSNPHSASTSLSELILIL